MMYFSHCVKSDATTASLTGGGICDATITGVIKDFGSIPECDENKVDSRCINGV